MGPDVRSSPSDVFSASWRIRVLDGDPQTYATHFYLLMIALKIERVTRARDTYQTMGTLNRRARGERKKFYSASLPLQDEAHGEYQSLELKTEKILYAISAR